MVLLLSFQSRVAGCTAQTFFTFDARMVSYFPVRRQGGMENFLKNFLGRKNYGWQLPSAHVHVHALAVYASAQYSPSGNVTECASDGTI